MTVEAFLDYSQNLGNIAELEAHLESLAADHRQALSSDQSCLTVTTIFRSKGLEWPVVYVPHCNQGYIPYASAHSLEEERRLFYVAVTRPREQLYLYVLQNLPLSRFLAEASWQQTLEQVQETRRLLANQLEHWNVEELMLLAHNCRSLVLQRYLEHWWQVSPELRQRLQQKIGNLLTPTHDHEPGFWRSPENLPPNFTPAISPAVPAGIPPVLEQQLRQLTPYLIGSEEYSIGESVWSERYGAGKIVALEAHERQGALLEVDFETSGTHKLLARYANLKKAQPSRSES